MADDKRKHLGSSLDEFLGEEGYLDELTALATKEVLAWQIAQAMRAKGLSKVKMADRMKTSRSQVDRLLDPKDGNVTLATMQKAAWVLGESLHIGLGEKKAGKRKAGRVAASALTQRGRKAARSKSKPVLVPASRKSG